MPEKELPLNSSLDSQIARQLKVINDERITLLIHKTKNEVYKLSDINRQKYLLHHVILILKKIQHLKLTESVKNSIVNIIEEKWHDFKRKKIKTLHLYLRAVEEGISDIAMQELGIEVEAEEEHQLSKKTEPQESEELEENELEEAEEEGLEREEKEEEEEEREHEEHENELEAEEVEGNELEEKEEKEEEIEAEASDESESEEKGEEFEEHEGEEEQEEHEEDEQEEESIEEEEKEKEEDIEESEHAENEHDLEHETEAEKEGEEHKETEVEALEREGAELKKEADNVENLQEQGGHFFTPLEDFEKRHSSFTPASHVVDDKKELKGPNSKLKG